MSDRFDGACVCDSHVRTQLEIEFSKLVSIPCDAGCVNMHTLLFITLFIATLKPVLQIASFLYYLLGKFINQYAIFKLLSVYLFVQSLVWIIMFWMYRRIVWNVCTVRVVYQYSRTSRLLTIVQIYMYKSESISYSILYNQDKVQNIM